MENSEISLTALYVMIAGACYEFEGADKETLTDSLAMQMEAGEVFAHTSVKTGIVSMIKLAPGMPVQIIPGAALQTIMRNQRMAAMQQPAPVRRM